MVSPIYFVVTAASSTIFLSLLAFLCFEAWHNFRDTPSFQVREPKLTAFIISALAVSILLSIVVQYFLLQSASTGDTIDIGLALHLALMLNFVSTLAARMSLWLTLLRGWYFFYAYKMSSFKVEYIADGLSIDHGHNFYWKHWSTLGSWRAIIRIAIIVCIIFALLFAAMIALTRIGAPFVFVNAISASMDWSWFVPTTILVYMTHKETQAIGNDAEIDRFKLFLELKVFLVFNLNSMGMLVYKPNFIFLQ